MVEQLKALIERAQSILITAHISPDPDSVAAVLLIGTTLKLNYPQKRVNMVMEEPAVGLDFLDGYSDIQFRGIDEAVEELKPDLFIMLDVNNVHRVTRSGEAAVRTYLDSSKTPLVIIDHHPQKDGQADKAELSLISSSIASTEDIYKLLFDDLQLKKPEGYAQTTLMGIFADSGGFVYANPEHRQTFQIVSDLLEAGGSLEEINRRLNQYTDDEMTAIAELAANLSHQDGYTYSYLSDSFCQAWQAAKKPSADLKAAKSVFIDAYIRNVGGRKWGFVVAADPDEPKGTYSVSLRSVANSMDVSEVAGRLGGGGHKPAAGAKFKANDIDDAIDQIKQAVTPSDS